jgi:hypothetical protein
VSQLVASAFAIVALLGASTIASAQGLAHRLAAPRASTDHRIMLNLTTSLDSDRATVRRADSTERCLVPCELALWPGSYRVRFERAAQEVGIELTSDPILVYSRPMNDTELGIGLGLIGVGAVALVVLGVLDNELCLALDGTCPNNGIGYLVLGLGAMSVLIGIGLSIDSMGRVDIVTMPRL